MPPIGGFFVVCLSIERCNFEKPQMINNFDCPAADLYDFGDHTGLTALIQEVGLMIQDQEYWSSNESVDIPKMQRLA